jgi:hypothetical protein
VSKQISPAVFEDYRIRRVYDEATETWYFSVVDIIQVLIQQPDYQTARKYWNKLKERLKKEGSQSVTNCHRLKLEAADGKKLLLHFMHHRHPWQRETGMSNLQEHKSTVCSPRAFVARLRFLLLILPLT